GVLLGPGAPGARRTVVARWGTGAAPGSGRPATGAGVAAPDRAAPTCPGADRCGAIAQSAGLSVVRAGASGRDGARRARRRAGALRPGDGGARTDGGRSCPTVDRHRARRGRRGLAVAPAPSVPSGARVEPGRVAVTH